MKRHVSYGAYFALIAASTLGLVGCGKDLTKGLPNPSSRYAAETKGYSAVVMVILPGGRSICSGAIISPRAVLTAAHCLIKSGRYQIEVDGRIFSTYTRVWKGQGTVESTDDIGLLLFSEIIGSGPDQIYEIGGDIREKEQLRLVGYGCQNIETREGSGVKRTGLGVVAFLDDYINFLTPQTSSSTRGIMGPDNLAGSCFGDSGGPALSERDGKFQVVGITHAGGRYGNNYISEYTDITGRVSDNRSWLAQMNDEHDLDIRGF